MPKVRDKAIDALKGFLIVMVVLAHNSASHPFVLEFCHPALMGIFFMVSGYLTYGRPELPRRLKGIFLPMLFFASFSILWRWGYSFISHEPLAWSRWAIELLAGEDWGLNIPMWFLLSYAQILVLVYVVNLIGNNMLRWSVVVLLMAVGLEMMRHGVNPLYIGRTLAYLPFFMVGGELHRVSDSFPAGRYPFLTILAIAAIIWGRIGFAPEDYYLRWFVDTALAVILAYLFYNLFKAPWFPAGLFGYYGRNSIVVLCVHILILDVVWRLWFARFGTPAMTGALMQTVAVCLLLVPFCEIYSKYIQPRLR